jgi:peroxiredoxin family protein
MSNRISVICITGTREKLQMGAMVASVGAATGADVTVFLSMNALPYFVKDSTEVAPSEGEMGRVMDAEPGVPDYKELFQQAVELGDAKILPCPMVMDVLKLSKDDLMDEVGPVTGLTKFLSDAEGSQVFTF